MVYAPGHFQRTGGPARRRYRSRRERLAVRVAALVSVVLLGLVLYSLSNHQRKTGNGCIDFSYSTMIGGAEMYKCGATARTLCLTQPGGASVDGDFEKELYIACRQAGFPTGRSRSGSGTHT